LIARQALPTATTPNAVDKRYQTNFRYGQMNSPFEYEKVRYIYTESRKLQISE
jgi:phospholipid-binding lipoprotein MlaA